MEEEYSYQQSDGKDFHQTVAYVIIGLAPLVLIFDVLLKPSTYGKLHDSKSSYFGPLVPARICWVIFESPNLLWVIYSLYEHQSTARTNNSNNDKTTTTTTTTAAESFFSLPWSNLILLCMFTLHYINRTIIYPVVRMSPKSRFPIGLLTLTIPYCFVNGYLQGQGICKYQIYSEQYHFSLQFVLGVVIFITGFTLNYQSDLKLCILKKIHNTYVIPTGFGFDHVSTPHFLGEIIEWIGFAIAANSIAAWSFAIWTACNLIPRGLSQHYWYHTKFDNYPPERYAIIPFLI